MATIQCKMCGGMVEVESGITSRECPYCGTLTTFPKVSGSHGEQLYNRAEHFRQIGDFDKAVAAYEELVRQVDDDPEPYWGLVISRFGIEYVEDPATHERIPTCHRVQLDSILLDDDYQKALELSSGAQRDFYEAQAKRIAEIQKDILAISAKEKPYDVFICYKEATDGGTRTKDSALAQDVYYQLINEGLKVFFARISLEDKLGQQYEPYIFAALNSAKVMLVIGSRREYFNAVWVKNEWSRFLALMRKDHTRLLIPCYREMDPYDIPEELSMLQSQDMSKIGFVQDLLRGIRKVIERNEGKQEPRKASAGGTSNASPSENITSLLDRAMIFLECEDWQSAKDYANRVLDVEPKNGKAYLVQFMAEHHFTTIEKFQNIAPAVLRQDKKYELALRFGDEDTRAMLSRQEKLYLQEQENKKREEERQKREKERYWQERRDRFDRLVEKYQACTSPRDCNELAEFFLVLKNEGFEKAGEYVDLCRQKARQCEYEQLVAAYELAQTEEEYKRVAQETREFSDIPDAKNLRRNCVIEIWKIREKYGVPQNADKKLEIENEFLDEYLKEKKEKYENKISLVLGPVTWILALITFFAVGSRHNPGTGEAIGSYLFALIPAAGVILLCGLVFYLPGLIIYQLFIKPSLKSSFRKTLMAQGGKQNTRF